ncbi:hypothetical protein [Allosphingosinicella sp.]|jgi:hypothetical protein|uniref:hypothetical protein n=1 Tax=Allosphingosinicella sp. TaxID=2823234 RepID=UPI002EE352D4
MIQHLARLVLGSFRSFSKRRRDMARLEAIAFCFIATATAYLTLATVAPVA